MADSNVRASHEKVVSSKVVKKPGVFGGITGLLGDLGKSIKGIFGGCIMIVIGFAVIVAGVLAVPDDSKILKRLDLKEATEISDDEGLVKFKGKADIETPIELSYQIKGGYGIRDQIRFDQDMLYFKADYQIFEQVESTTTETRTVVENGTEVEQTVEKTEIEEEWVTKFTDERMAGFTIGGIEITTDGISKKFDYKTETVEEVEIDATATVYENPSDKVGNTRLVIEYVTADDELIVAGDIHNGKISKGDVFVLSNLSDEKLIDQLETEEGMIRWGLRILAWVLLTAGFSALVAPILVVTKVVPGLNKVTGCITSIVFGTLSAIIVLLVTLLVKYWFIVIFCTLGLVGIMIAGVVMYASKKK